MGPVAPKSCTEILSGEGSGRTDGSSGSRKVELALAWHI